MRLPLPAGLSLVLFVASCASTPTPITVSRASALTSVDEVNKAIDEVNSQIDALYTPRSIACQGDKACLDRAKAEVEAILGDRIALAHRARIAQNQAADELAVGVVCKAADTDCQKTVAQEVALRLAVALVAVATLKHTPPLPPASGAPAASSSPPGVLPPPAASSSALAPVLGPPASLAR